MLKSKVLSGWNLLGFKIFLNLFRGVLVYFICTRIYTNNTLRAVGRLKHSIYVVQCDLKYISLTFWYDYFGIVIYSESSQLKYTNCCLMSNMLQHVALCTIMSSEESCEVCRLAVHSLVDRQVDGQTDRQRGMFLRSPRRCGQWRMWQGLLGFPRSQGRPLPSAIGRAGRCRGAITEWVNVGTVPARTAINHFWEVGRCKNLGHCVRKGVERNICVRRVRTVAQNNQYTPLR